MGYYSALTDMPFTIKLDGIRLGMDTLDKPAPSAHPGVIALAQSVRDQAAKEPGIDLSAVTKAVETATAEYNRRIERALESVADLEVLKKSSGRRFVVVYWHNNASVTTEGIEYPERKDGKGNALNYGVLVDSFGHPFGGSYLTMSKFREFFAGRSIPFRIVYLDK